MGAIRACYDLLISTVIIVPWEFPQVYPSNRPTPVRTRLASVPGSMRLQLCEVGSEVGDDGEEAGDLPSDADGVDLP